MDRMYFIEVTGEDGRFFDRVSEELLESHVIQLFNGFYAVHRVDDEDVPACRYREFSEGLEFCEEKSWNGGSEFYF